MTTVIVDPQGGEVISSVGLGTWTFAGDAIWGESEERESLRVVHAALDRGITFFDTAPNYGDGRSEEVLGRALRGRPGAMVASKIKIEGKSADDIRRSVEESLRRLGREHLDMLQIHWPASTIEGTLRGLESFLELQRRGLVRHLGVCNFGRFDLEDLNRSEARVLTNQLPYNLLWRVIETEIAPATKERGLTTIAYTTLGQGLLTGAYRDLTHFPEGRKRTRHFSGEHPAAKHGGPGMEAAVQSALTALDTFSRNSGRSMLELALGFVRRRRFIDVILVGARDERQLADTLEAAECRLTADEVAALERITEPVLRAAGGNPDMYQSISRVRYTPLSQA